MDNYIQIKTIGRGTYGVADLVLHKEEQRHYVAKKILIGTLKPQEKKKALIEADVLRSLDHPFIVQYKESFIENEILTIVMEYWERGDLHQYIQARREKNKPIKEAKVLNWFSQISMALQHVHGKHILHRDIKASNIFLTKSNTVKLGDFGIWKMLQNTCDKAFTIVGTPFYMSPEICEQRAYTNKADVWAAGCLLYELCTFQYPFNAANIIGLVMTIVRDDFQPIPNQYSQFLAEIIQNMLTKNPLQRPSLAEVLRDPNLQPYLKDFVASHGQRWRKCRRDVSLDRMSDSDSDAKSDTSVASIHTEYSFNSHASRQSNFTSGLGALNFPITEIDLESENSLNSIEEILEEKYESDFDSLSEAEDDNIWKAVSVYKQTIEQLNHYNYLDDIIEVSQEAQDSPTQTGVEEEQSNL